MLGPQWTSLGGGGAMPCSRPRRTSVGYVTVALRHKLKPTPSPAGPADTAAHRGRHESSPPPPPPSPLAWHGRQHPARPASAWEDRWLRLLPRPLPPAESLPAPQWS